MKMGNKQVLSIVFSVVLLLSFVSGVYAITGSIGNAKMILRPDVGEEVRRSILVKNVNDIALDISLKASGDLVNDIKIEDDEFRLEAGDERKAYFTIKTKNPGTFENKINVKFSPVDGGDGVGLISTVILIAEGESEDDGGIFGGLFGGEGGEEVVEGNQENGEVSVGQDKQDDVSGEVGESKPTNWLAVSGGFTILLFIALLVVLVIASNKIKKKGSAGKSDLSDLGHPTKSEKEKSSDE